MPRPKQLKLREALSVTRKPLARFGDLIAVQIHSQLGNHRDFPNGEMRSIFMPHHRDWSMQSFPQPETEAYLRDLYLAGGRIESIADFDDESLAVHYNYTAGINVGGFAGNAGDARCFELDCIEAVGSLPPNSSRELVSAVVGTVRLMHKKYKLSANAGTQFQNKQNEKSRLKRPVENEMGQSLNDVIAALAREHSGSGPTEIWPHLKSAIGEWSGDRVTESGAGDSRRYSFVKRNGNRGTVTFGPFGKKLATLRKK
ncbi:hypothetical protein [Caballeronia sp. 15711]|uniref:hypothetical protein n=1 Tax=Caballeronia sp. 15711 TaxID=3391029 RepID=UPI0039E6A212